MEMAVSRRRWAVSVRGGVVWEREERAREMDWG